MGFLDIFNRPNKHVENRGLFPEIVKESAIAEEILVQLVDNFKSVLASKQDPRILEKLDAKMKLLEKYLKIAYDKCKPQIEQTETGLIYAKKEGYHLNSGQIETHNFFLSLKKTEPMRDEIVSFLRKHNLLRMKDMIESRNANPKDFVHVLNEGLRVVRFINRGSTPIANSKYYHFLNF